MPKQMSSNQGESAFDRELGSKETAGAIRAIGTKAGITNLDDLDDFSQEVYHAAVKSRDGYDATQGTLASWIRKIAKNKAVDFHRRRAAAKRRAVGGEISLDAEEGPIAHKISAAMSEATDSERDTKAFETKDELHSLREKTKLTKKQVAALDNYRSAGQKSQTPANPGPFRRAKESLAMTHKKSLPAPRAHPDPAECGYGRIAASQIPAAVIYELARQTRWFVDEVLAWRGRKEWARLQAAIKRQKKTGTGPILMLGQSWPQRLQKAYTANDYAFYSDVRASVEVAAEFPEWPEKSYLSLDPVETPRRLQWYSWIFAPEPLFEMTDPIVAVLVQAGAEPMPEFPSPSEYTNWINQSFPNGSDAYNSTHIFRINWREAEETIVKSFSRWLHQKRLGHLDVPAPRRPVAGRKSSRSLTNLAVVRLIDEFRLPGVEARLWLARNYGGTAPTTAEPFRRALRDGREMCKTFLPSPD